MSAMTRPVCVQHRCEMVPEKNSYAVLVMASWGPYEVHLGDKYKCPIGGEEIVSGWGKDAIARHHERDIFDQWLARVDLEMIPQ